MVTDNKLKIVHVSSEVEPFSKAGGMANVARSLPKAQKRLGHEVIVVTPLYGKIIDKKKHALKLFEKNVEIQINSRDKVKVNFWRGYLMPNLPVYFIENKKYFSKRKTLYGSDHENARFMMFDVASLKLISLLNFKADIVHCHEWHTGLIPFYLKTNFRYSRVLKKAKTLFTIHNLVFQLGHNWWEIPLDKKDYGRKRLPGINNPDVEYVNFSKRAILSADAINTVSERYRDEIMTKKFGQDLHRVLKNREDRLFGIVNGIDYRAYSPKNDPGLYKNYNDLKRERRAENKIYLQKNFNLPVDVKIPLFCATSRVTFQKGFELVLNVMEELLRLDIQIIIMGDGDKEYIKRLKKFQRKYPKKLVWRSFNQKKETSMYAGADMFLLPSHHEPCGINQLIAMRYGCIPVVRKVGGLYDTVINFSPATGHGTGFTFERFSEFDMYGAIIRAIETFKYKNVWDNLVLRAMQQSNSWRIPARKYILLYRRILKLNGQSKHTKK